MIPLKKFELIGLNLQTIHKHFLIIVREVIKESFFLNIFYQENKRMDFCVFFFLFLLGPF